MALNIRDYRSFTYKNADGYNFKGTKSGTGRRQINDGGIDYKTLWGNGSSSVFKIYYGGTPESFEASASQINGYINASTAESDFNGVTWSIDPTLPLYHGDYGNTFVNFSTNYATYQADPATVGAGGWGFLEGPTPNQKQDYSWLDSSTIGQISYEGKVLPYDTVNATVGTDALDSMYDFYASTAGVVAAASIFGTQNTTMDWTDLNPSSTGYINTGDPGNAFIFNQFGAGHEFLDSSFNFTEHDRSAGEGVETQITMPNVTFLNCTWRQQGSTRVSTYQDSNNDKNIRSIKLYSNADYTGTDSFQSGIIESTTYNGYRCFYHYIKDATKPAHYSFIFFLDADTATANVFSQNGNTVNGTFVADRIEFGDDVREVHVVEFVLPVPGVIYTALEIVTIFQKLIDARKLNRQFSVDVAGGEITLSKNASPEGLTVADVQTGQQLNIDGNLYTVSGAPTETTNTYALTVPITENLAPLSGLTAMDVQVVTGSNVVTLIPGDWAYVSDTNYYFSKQSAQGSFVIADGDSIWISDDAGATYEPYIVGTSVDAGDYYDVTFTTAPTLGADPSVDVVVVGLDPAVTTPTVEDRTESIITVGTSDDASQSIDTLTTAIDMRTGPVYAESLTFNNNRYEITSITVNGAQTEIKTYDDISALTASTGIALEIEFDYFNQKYGYYDADGQELRSWDLMTLTEKTMLACPPYKILMNDGSYMDDPWGRKMMTFYRPSTGETFVIPFVPEADVPHQDSGRYGFRTDDSHVISSGISDEWLTNHYHSSPTVGDAQYMYIHTVEVWGPDRYQIPGYQVTTPFVNDEELIWMDLPSSDGVNSAFTPAARAVIAGGAAPYGSSGWLDVWNNMTFPELDLDSLRNYTTRFGERKRLLGPTRANSELSPINDPDYFDPNNWEWVFTDLGDIPVNHSPENGRDYGTGVETFMRNPLLPQGVTRQSLGEESFLLNYDLFNYYKPNPGQPDHSDMDMIDYYDNGTQFVVVSDLMAASRRNQREELIFPSDVEWDVMEGGEFPNPECSDDNGGGGGSARPDSGMLYPRGDVC